MSVTPKSSWPWVRTLLHSIFDQPDAESVVAQYDRVLDALADKLRRRTDVVGIFSDRTAIIRLVGAVLAEQHDEWIEGRRYLGLDILARSRITLTPGPTEMTPDSDLQALSA